MEKSFEGVFAPRNCTPRIVTIEAPCKINLHLGIGQKRPDGFHELESIFASLALGDTLRFERCGEKGAWHLFMNWEVPETPIPPEKNLVLRAVSLFREKTGFNPGLSIDLVKRIPAGAGLGGGSSDAASALLAMNLLSSSALTMDELGEMAALLGSDVPFFLSGGAAFVSGRGEKTEPVKAPGGLWVVLVKPPFSSDTAGAYRLLDEARERAAASPMREPVKQGLPKEELPKEGLPKEELPKEALISALAQDPHCWPFKNDFLAVFLDPDRVSEREQGEIAFAQRAAYRAILGKLRSEGASFAGLSGSGSCCFGVFSARQTAEKAVKAFTRKEFGPVFRAADPSNQGIFVRLTFFVAQNSNAVLE